MIPAADRAAADTAYVYGIPALVVVGVLLLVLLAVLLPALTAALRDLATVGRLLVAYRGDAEERARVERAAILAEVVEVRKLVVARL